MLFIIEKTKSHGDVYISFSHRSSFFRKQKNNDFTRYHKVEHFPISQTITTSRLLTRNPQNQKPQEYENCLFFAETNQLWKYIDDRDPISSQTVESLNCVWRKRGLLARGNKNCTYKEFRGRSLAHSLQSSKAKEGFSHSFSAFSKKNNSLLIFCP